MTKRNQLPSRIAPTARGPVRVKLRRVHCDHHEPYAPESMKRDWWARLKRALGTRSPDFIAATLRQIEIASRLPYEGTSEVAVNAALAIIEGAQPRNQLIKASAVQMEQLRKSKGGQSQYVRVEHVHVNGGGQAVIGNVKTSGARACPGE